MRICRGCGKTIPNKIQIDGVTKVILNRKFCLECSPFGAHNTSKYDPVKRVERDYGKYSPEQKERVKLCLYKRALERKIKIIELAGGCCKRCGYNKNRRALTFHHKDRLTKSFGLSLNYLWSKPWDLILEELDKCELYCMNCHAEIEDELEKQNSITARVNEKYGTNF